MKIDHYIVSAAVKEEIIAKLTDVEIIDNTERCFNLNFETKDSMFAIAKRATYTNATEFKKVLNNHEKLIGHTFSIIPRSKLI